MTIAIIIEGRKRGGLKRDFKNFRVVIGWLVVDR